MKEGEHMAYQVAIVDDSKTGYGIYAENMLDTAENIGNGVLGGLQDKELKQAS